HPGPRWACPEEGAPGGCRRRLRSRGDGRRAAIRRRCRSPANRWEVVPGRPRAARCAPGHPDRRPPTEAAPTGSRVAPPDGRRTWTPPEARAEASGSGDLPGVRHHDLVLLVDAEALEARLADLGDASLLVTHAIEGEAGGFGNRLPIQETPVVRGARLLRDGPAQGTVDVGAGHGVTQGEQAVKSHRPDAAAGRED